MRPKLIGIFLFIVLVPLILLTWIGVKTSHDEQEVLQDNMRRHLASRLRDVGATVEKLIHRRERELLRFAQGPSPSADAIRDAIRREPRVRQVFVLTPEAKRLHPPPEGPLSDAERQFLERAGQIWADKQVFYLPPESQSASRDANSHSQSDHGWYVWYWGSGVNLVFWRRDDSGHVVGVELNRARLIADIIAELPDSGGEQPRLPHGRIALVDSKGQTIYQWGAYDPPEDERPQVGLRLKHPLASWRLDYFASAAEFGEALAGSMFLNLVMGLSAVAIALVGMAVYFYRESSRELREAAQRVSFVNQVSHELKTPLTNIRMYGELLQDQIPEDEEKASQYVDVVVTESERLSRLIGNVLTFARQQRDQLVLRTAPGCADDVIRSVLAHFRPSLEAKGVEVEFVAGAPACVELDSDVLEQILGNLFGNVEKYAASGGFMRVGSKQDGERTLLTVADRGPGIPKGREDEIFRPFRRLSNRLTDGVTGTGIGLSIARDLAQLHGGDLRLVPSEEGACFEVELRTPQASTP